MCASLMIGTRRARGAIRGEEGRRGASVKNEWECNEAVFNLNWRMFCHSVPLKCTISSLTIIINYLNIFYTHPFAAKLCSVWFSAICRFQLLAHEVCLYSCKVNHKCDLLSYREDLTYETAQLTARVYSLLSYSNYR